jgi:hypothetical protein
MKPSPIPLIVHVSPYNWPLRVWKARTPPRGAIAIPLFLQNEAFGPPWPTDASYVRRVSNSRMNLIVILVTNAQIFSELRPRVSVRKSFFRMEKYFPDIFCSMHLWFGCYSGHPATTMGLATVTYALLSTVTRNLLSPIQLYD